jgi:hypothetical protein
MCGSGTTCTAQASFDSATSETYVAMVQDYSGDTAAQSATQRVTWVGNAPSNSWTVSLTTDPIGVQQAGETVTLTADAGQDVGPAGYSIAILDTGASQVVISCDSGSTCSSPVSFDTADTETYMAEIVDDSGKVIAQSDAVQVTWEDNTGAADSTLGSVDFNGYCQSLGDQGAVLNGSTAYDWQCDDGSGDYTSIDADAACQWQYPDQNAVALLGDVNDPYSWSCQAGS